MTSSRAMPTADGPHTGPVVLTSAVLAVVIRVAGPVTTGVVPYGLRTPERQVNVRIGDAVVHVTDPKAAARIRQRWDASVGLALRLRERVSQTWLQPRPGTYPAAVSVQLTRNVDALGRRPGRAARRGARRPGRRGRRRAPARPLPPGAR